MSAVKIAVAFLMFFSMGLYAAPAQAVEVANRVGCVTHAEYDRVHVALAPRYDDVHDDFGHTARYGTSEIDGKLVAANYFPCWRDDRRVTVHVQANQYGPGRVVYYKCIGNGPGFGC